MCKRKIAALCWLKKQHFQNLNHRGLYHTQKTASGGGRGAREICEKRPLCADRRVCSEAHIPAPRRCTIKTYRRVVSPFHFSNNPEASAVASLPFWEVIAPALYDRHSRDSLGQECRSPRTTPCIAVPSCRASPIASPNS